MRGRINKGRAAGAAGLLVAMLVGLPSGRAGADSATDWVVSARAGAADMGITTTGGFIVDRIDPGAALAMNHVETATGQSTSLASAPYPSEVGEQGPGLVYGVLQNTLPYNGIPVPALPVAPAWPWTVRASSGGADPPSASLGDATSPFRLKSSAAPREAAASADAGGSQPGAFSFMHMQATSAINAEEAGQASLTAASKVENLMIGGQVKVGEIVTTLDLTRAAGGQPVAKVTRSIKGLEIGGVAAEWTPKGFVFQGTTTPLPAPLMDGLKSAGIELVVGTEETIEGGVRAKGLTVRMPFDFSGMSNDQFPFSTPHTMTLEWSFGTVTGSIEQVGIDRPVADYAVATSAPATAATAAESEPISGPAAAVIRPTGTQRTVGAAGIRTPEPISGPETAGIRPTGTQRSVEEPVAFVPAAATAPVGISGKEARDEMGTIGWIAQAGAIALVVLLVVGRARRAVVSK